LAKFLQQVLDEENTPTDSMDESIAKEISQFWNEKSTQELLKRSHQISLLDSAF
jgi:hypothetical protein